MKRIDRSTAVPGEVKVLRLAVLVLSLLVIALLGFGTDVGRALILGKAPLEETAQRAKITPEEAHEVALAVVREATVRRTELEERDGTLVYAVELDAQGKDVEVLVDAESGSVVRTEFHVVMYARLGS